MFPMLNRNVFWACALLLLTPATAPAQEGDDAAWWSQYRAGSHLVALPGGRKLNLYCTGAGAPLVMMESGLGAGAWTWRAVQAAIGRVTRTCVYDRAGYWLSPGAPGPRDAGTEANDLAALLQAAALPGPYVLVAHSYGGYIVRLYASRHPQTVAGLVLVDPSSEFQDRRAGELVPRLAKATQDAIAPLQPCAADPRPVELTERCVQHKPPADLPSNMKDWFAALQGPAYARAMIGEYDDMQGLSSRQLAAEKKGLGAIPLVLLNRGKPVEAPGGQSAEESAALSALWLQMHKETLDISGNAELRIVAGAGHLIQDDQPQAVVQAVTDVVAKARASKGAGAKPTP
jgi:pimeloyl-ACP methyl ester carboxylesterase